jgi:hypothetical protein
VPDAGRARGAQHGRTVIGEEAPREIDRLDRLQRTPELRVFLWRSELV